MIMILRFYSPLTIKCDTPRYVVPGELVSVLDAIPVRCQKHFDDLVDLFAEHYLEEEHQKNYAVHSVVPMPCIHNAVPYICWTVKIDIHYNFAYPKFCLEQCIRELNNTINDQIYTKWGKELEALHVDIQGDIYSLHCSPTDRVIWPGVWCADSCIVPCNVYLYGLTASLPDRMIKHGWLEPKMFECLCDSIKKWVNCSDAVRKCKQRCLEIGSNHDVDATFIASTIDWLRKRTNDKELIKNYNKVYNKMAKLRHEGTN